MLEKLLNEQSWMSERMAYFEKWFKAPVGGLVSLHRSIGLSSAVSKMPAEERIEMLPLLRFDSQLAEGRPEYDIFNIDHYHTGVFLYLGVGRSGKTASLYDILSRSRYPSYFLEVDKRIWLDVPDPVRFRFYSTTKDFMFKLLPPSGMCYNVVMDDAALFSSSRKTSDSFNKALQEFVTIISHKDILLHVLIQNTGLLDFKALRGQGVRILQKYSPTLSASFEREELAHSVEVANSVLRLYADAHGVDVRWFLYDHEDRKVYLSKLPEWYSDKLSKPYRNYFVEVKK